MVGRGGGLWSTLAAMAAATVEVVVMPLDRFVSGIASAEKPLIEAVFDATTGEEVTNSSCVSLGFSAFKATELTATTIAIASVAATAVIVVAAAASVAAATAVTITATTATTTMEQWRSCA